MRAQSHTETLSEDAIFEVIEGVLDHAEWAFERETEDTLHCVGQTRWGEMSALFTIRDDPGMLHFTMTLDVKPTAARRQELCDLLARINERLWIGHFDFWREENVLMFRHAITLVDRRSPTGGEIDAILSAAVDALERFTPAMNFVIWAGKPAEEALEAAMIDVVGEA